MAILKVARMGHPILRERAAEVPETELGGPEIRELIGDMIATMREYDGAGLAAPQVHVSRRVVVMEVKDNPRYPDAPRVPLTVIVNPVITPLTEDMMEVWEGCLSIPDIRGKVPRLSKIRLEAHDENGAHFTRDFEGFPAAVVQHECDHLDGILYIDRVEDTTSLAFLQEFNRHHHR